ncbi:phosphatidylinositol-specific phospholipase [Coniochaeta sp. 2T2.1]|nr:phosphatidylinositol-specific phospholipase [Coniochaeta sp. 2T2.1]
MAWQPHGLSGSGFLQDAQDGRSKTAPAVATYRGQLWCLWADMDDSVWYAATTSYGGFGKRQRFPERGLPVLTNLNGTLHAIITLQTGEMVHYLLYDDKDGQAWVYLGTVADAITHSTPCLVAFHNKLFLVYLHDAALYYLIWTRPITHSNSASELQGIWSQPATLGDGQTFFRGIPALFVTNGALHALCGESGANSEIRGFKYDHMSSKWTTSEDMSGGRAVSGVSATSFSDKAYLGFVENGPGHASHAVHVAAFTDGKWQPQEDVDGQTAADPPQLAILNGRIHCIFNDNTESRDLRWYSRPVLNYSLSSWMEGIPDHELISHLTIPGTHDSCARSNIAFVRTQYLNITEQLAMGIRFLDLRLRLHDDGLLYLYHGGFPIDYPKTLSFASVMDEVWTFLRGPEGTRPPTETVLISINNDDSSPEQLLDPAPFYRAVETAIAATPPYPDGKPRWFVDPLTPILGEVRGRAVLLRRYKGDTAIDSVSRLGLDLSAWLNDNPEFTIVTPTNVRIHLQDKWRYTERVSLEQLVISKSGHVQQLMDRAANGQPSTPRADHEDDWFINFNSAVGDPVKHGEVAQAKWVAVGAHTGWWRGKWVDGMNVRTREFLELLENRDPGSCRRRLGIVNLDFPELPADNDIVSRLVEMNY